MYSRRERPLSLAERQHLRERLRGLVDEMVGNLGFCLGVCVTDLLIIASVIATFSERKSINVCGSVGWGMALLIFNVWLCGTVVNFIGCLLERRRVRQVLKDGFVIVERVIARRASCIRWGVEFEWRVLLAVSDETVLVLPSSAIPIRHSDAQPDPKAGSLVPAFFERVTTRLHGMPLGTTTIGQTGTPYPTALELAKVIADSQSQKRIATRLMAPSLVLRGNLANLPALLEGEAIEGDVLGNELDELQARVEERFGQDYGPGGLARRQPGNVNELVDLIVRRLPPGAKVRMHPARNAFYRLRAALSEELNLERRTIRPDTALETLIPRRNRQQTWKRLGEKLGRPLPGFAPRSLPGCSISAWAVALVVCYVFGSPSLLLFQSLAQTHRLDRQPWFVWGTALAQLAVVLLTVAAGCLLLFVLWRQRRHCEFDAQRATVGQVARCLAEAGEGVDVAWTEETVYHAVRIILAQVRGCRPMDVTWTTRLCAQMLAPGSN